MNPLPRHRWTADLLFWSGQDVAGQEQSLSPPPWWLTFVFWCVYVMTVCFSSYFVFTNSQYLERLYEQAIDRAETSEDQEAVEQAYDNTRRVVDNPVWRLAAAAWTAGHGLVSAGLLMLTCWFMLWVASYHWIAPSLLCYDFGTASLAPAIGTIIHSIGNVWTGDESFRCALSYLLTPSLNSTLNTLLRESDLFTLLAIWIFSVRLSRRMAAERIHMFSLMMGVWILLLLVAQLAGFSIYLTL